MNEGSCERWSVISSAGSEDRLVVVIVTEIEEAPDPRRDESKSLFDISRGRFRRGRGELK